MEWSDEVLMQRLKGGDLQAFETLYLRHQQRIENFFKKRQASKAQDLGQEVFMRLLERREQWNGQPFLPWFFVMARHLMIDEWRKEKKAIVDFEKSEEIDISDWLEELDASQRQLIFDRYFAGKDFKELSEEYGTSEVSLRQRMTRLLKSMRGSL